MDPDYSSGEQIGDRRRAELPGIGSYADLFTC
jgi:hypothetical protein